MANEKGKTASPGKAAGEYRTIKLNPIRVSKNGEIRYDRDTGEVVYRFSLDDIDQVQPQLTGKRTKVSYCYVPGQRVRTKSGVEVYLPSITAMASFDAFKAIHGEAKLLELPHYGATERTKSAPMTLEEYIKSAK